MSRNSDTWYIRETAFAVAHNRHFEGLMAIGSGTLQQRASLEEGFVGDPQDREFLRVMGNVTVEKFPDFKGRVGTFMPGVTGPHPTCGDELINLPALHGLILYSGAERLDFNRSRISAYERRLDLRTGRLSRSFVWHTQRGAEIELVFERFISAQRRHVMALRCRARHLRGPEAELRIVGALDADVRTNGFDHFTSVALTGESEPITVDIQTNGGDRVSAAALLTCEPGIVWNVETGPRWAAISGMQTLLPGGEITICKYAAMTSSRHVRGSVLDAARTLAWEAGGAGFERLAAESERVWEERWARTDVEIDGDAESQLALRTSLYHLMRAACEKDDRIAIDPKAAAGEAYCGRYFWDTEMFILPVFLYTRPHVARSLAGYRLRSLDGARRNARRYGYAGARYAWEASPTGDEHCPNWQYSDHEVHVTADVAYGLWHTHIVCPDDLGLLVGATEVLTETARYWRQRVTPNAQRDEYELLMVMGPDEYTPFSRNNAYTNWLVVDVLRLCTLAWDELSRRDASAAERLRNTLSLGRDELEQNAAIAGKLRIPRDDHRNLTLQSDDFFSYEPFDFARFWPDRTQPLGRTASQERLYRSQVLKQADVVQLMVLYPHKFDHGQLRVAYDTYEPLTSHDSSLSKSIHAVAAAWLGDTDEALRMWDESVGLDLQPGAAAEGIHAACCGGNWQTAIFGFAGVRTRMQSDLLHIRPHLPQRWTALRFPFVWNGQSLRVEITHDAIALDHRGEQALEADVAGKRVTVAAGQRTVIPLAG